MSSNIKAMLLEHAWKNCGIEMSSIAEELGKTNQAVVQWKNGKRNTDPEVFNIIEKRGKFLSQASLDRYDFDDICEEAGITKSFVAKKLGISKQALSEQEQNGFPEWRKKDVINLLRSVGKEMRQLARKARSK